MQDFSLKSVNVLFQLKMYQRFTSLNTILV